MGRKFEYLVLNESNVNEEELLCAFGVEGWELVSAVQPRVSVPVKFYFKREFFDETKTKI